MTEADLFLRTDGPILGQTHGEHRISRADEARAAALALARQARRTLRIFSRDLDGRLYSNEAFRSAVSELARASRYSGLSILVQDPARAVRDGHRLIDLAQALSSHIGVRRVAPDWQEEPGACLLADETGVLWRPNGEGYEGSVDFAAGPRARELRQWFDTVWEHSEPDPEFRRLGI
jgi:hypothetical protein